MDQVFDFIMNEKDDTHGDEMIIDDVMENKKTVRITENMLEAIIRRVIREKEKDTTLCERGITAAKAKYDVYPSAYANGYAVQVCKGDMPDVNGVKKCSGKYCSGK
jgi:5-enolpyruvylshikimate-3-phosphate synthase